MIESKQLQFGEYSCVIDDCGHLFRPQLTLSEHAGPHDHEAVLLPGCMHVLRRALYSLKLFVAHPDRYLLLSWAAARASLISAISK